MNSDDDKPEEYILTAEEAAAAIRHSVDTARNHLAWRMAQIGMQEDDILQKLSEINFQEAVNREDILQRCNSNKLHGIWEKEHRKKELQDRAQVRQQLKARCTNEYMFAVMKWASRKVMGKELLVNNDNQEMIKILCYWLSEDERLEKEYSQYSLSKGLMLRGPCGIGKTHIVTCCENNEFNPILTSSMLEISDEVKQTGEYKIELGSRKVLYLDDVGTEEVPINHFGTKVYWFKNFIETLYLQQLRTRGFNKIIISTNNNSEELERLYGFRVRRRLREMFNVVDIAGVGEQKKLFSN